MAGATIGSILSKSFAGIKKGWGTTTGLMSRRQKEFAFSVGASYGFHGIMDKDSNTFGSALGKSLVESAAAMAVGPGVYIAARVGMPITRAAFTAGPIAYRAKEASWNQYHKPNLGGSYIDTQQAATMRQAGIQAIQSSRLNGRNMLGNEASMMHR